MASTTTLSQIRSRQRQKLDDDAFDGVLLDQATNDYIDDLLGRHKFTFMETTAMASNSAGDYTTPLPSDMQELLALVCTTTKANLTKSFVDYDNFVTLYPTPSLTTASLPRYWTLYGNNIRWATLFDNPYSFSFDYLASPVHLVADTDICVIPDEFIEVVVLGGVYRAMKIDNDYSLSTAEAPDIQRMEVALMSRYGRGQNRAGPKRMMSSFRG